jgi:competence ComEA-like helix-hairpin-helix protein
MLEWLTPAERRGASVVVLLLLLGASYDGCRARRMRTAFEHVAATPYAPTLTLPTKSDQDSAPGGSEGHSTSALLDLNHASATDLDRLPGIGPVLAGRIVTYRGLHGPFRSVEELLGVRGIGPRLFARLEPLIRVADSAVGGVPTGLGQARSGPPRLVHSAQPGRQGRADSTTAETLSFR